MASAAHDYQHFVHWLHREGAGTPEDVRRFARLVLENFDRVSATSRNKSQRSVRLVELARECLSITDPGRPQLDSVGSRSEWRWQRLSQLSLGPFRGFRNSEAFEIGRRIVLFYGPNGSGKTSLCEALEYALLGAVDEGAQKRIDAARYLCNVHEGRFEPPILQATGVDGARITVESDADAYQFCFIEKNRIDSFSRIAAKTPGQKTELIAALFGMDDFAEFVSHFNDTIDGQLALYAVQSGELARKRQEIAQDEQLLAGEIRQILEFGAEEQEYARLHGNGLSYAQLQQAVGNGGARGRLQILTESLDQPAPRLYGIREQDLLDAFHAADAAHNLVLELTREIGQHQDGAAYQDLYNAVLNLPNQSPDCCPACDTGIGHVRTNPFTKAQRELDQLRELTLLRQRYQAALEQRRSASDALLIFFTNFAQCVGANVHSENELFRYLANPGHMQNTPWWQVQYTPVPGGISLAQQAVNYARQLEQLDIVTQQSLQQRQQLIAEREGLSNARIVLTEHATRRQQAHIAFAQARQRVALFEQDNADLIAAVAQEGARIAAERQIQEAYNEFLRLLRQYRAELPGTLMAGLNTLALELYNEFNVRDPDPDKLATLDLPVSAEGRIMLTFRGDPGRPVDALQVLSEGHVRCLGLAILLAKALSIRAPAIVFDDAINAIDHEHRQGIREALFQSGRFANTQIIVTCHSNEFIKDIQNNVDSNQWVSYTFRHHRGDHHPHVVRGGPPLAYLMKARAAVDRGDHRDALSPCRQAWEMLANRIWKWLGECGLGLISVKLGSATDQPSLKNLSDALRLRLHSANTFEHANKAPVLAALDEILGIPRPTPMWQYLNKGTHEEEDRDDFDEQVVERLVQLLEGVNALRLRNP